MLYRAGASESLQAAHEPRVLRAHPAAVGHQPGAVPFAELGTQKGHQEPTVPANAVVVSLLPSGRLRRPLQQQPREGHE